MADLAIGKNNTGTRFVQPSDFKRIVRSLAALKLKNEARINDNDNNHDNDSIRFNHQDHDIYHYF